MAVTQKIRGRLLSPLLTVLVRLGIQADHITLLSTIAGLSFCPLFFVCKPLSFVMLGLHVLLDGLDGPLARYTGTASNRGSFTDTMADQLVITASMITLICSNTVGILPGILYIVVYTTVVLFAFVRNTLAIPYTWLVRPRFFIYIWIVVDTYIYPGTIDYILWLFTVVLAVKVLTGFIKIRNRI